MNTPEIDNVRAALNDMLRELDKIEQGDVAATTGFAWKVRAFNEMDPGLMVQMHLWREDTDV